MAFFAWLVGVPGCIFEAASINKAIICGKGIAGLGGFFAKSGGAFEFVF